jgi:RNA ligase
MFKTIRHIDDVRPFVADKKEIRFQRQSNGVTIGCYMFMDSKTFYSPEALECRGIGFDDSGRVVSRPLHKFFNLGEKEWLSPDKVAQRTDLVAVFEKLDGSMLATAWVDNQLQWRSKKSFGSDVVTLTQKMLLEPDNAHIEAFSKEVAGDGMTAIFEMMHPQARIVVSVDKPKMRLLHVRDNETGEYVLLDPAHRIHAMVERHGVELAPRFSMTELSEVLASLDTMQEQEGYVLQFANGDMVKLKCPWYQRLHRSITFLRERDIALAALNEELDDLKAVLAEAGIDLAPVNEVEARVKARMLELMDAIETKAKEGAHLDRKGFALANQKDPLFGLMMAQYLGKEPDLREWFTKNRLKEEFSLRVLADGALAEAMEG